METSSPEQQAGRDARSARRRLIRGAFGAPAALTLYSGSALAATSLTCVKRRVSNAVNPGPTTAPGQDVYLRVQVKAKGTNDTASTWVSGADVLLAAATPAANSFLGSSGWYCLSAGANSGYTAGLTYTDADANASNKGGAPQPIASYVAIRVNEFGQIVGVTDTTSASAVSRSCWTSFNPAFPRA